MAMRRLKKKIFLGLFGGTVLLLGVVRLAFPEVTGGEKTDETQPVEEPVLTRENSSTHTRVLEFSHVSTGLVTVVDMFFVTVEREILCDADLPKRCDDSLLILR